MKGGLLVVVVVAVLVREVVVVMVVVVVTWRVACWWVPLRRGRAATARRPTREITRMEPREASQIVL